MIDGAKLMLVTDVGDEIDDKFGMLVTDFESILN